MNKLTHYTDARCHPIDGNEVTGSDIAFAMSRMFKVVHDMNANGVEIAIDLPGLKVGSGGEALGEVFRVFGDPSSIERFLSHADVYGLLIASGITSNGVKPVPQTQKWATLSRDRASDRAHAGWSSRSQRRLERRAIARGDDPAKIAHLKGREGRIAAKSEETTRRRIPFLNVSSRSTGCNFNLFLRRNVLDKECGLVFDSYGLATREGGKQAKGCVPAF
jgi:CRISPR-associated endoribonuclease Cas6/Csy4 subtype I-F